MIKNSTSQVSQAVASIPANHRFCLTGTPIENHLGELWTQFRFLLPGLLGDQTSFKKNFRRPIEEFGDVERKAVLTKRIRPFTMRRTKNEVAADLPEKTTIIETIELEGAQRDLYETVRLASTKQVRTEIAEKGFKQSQIMILDALLKLRQVCCDPRLVKLTAARKVNKSTKLELLTAKILELAEEDRKVLVFSQFTSMLDLIALELQKLGIEFVQLRGDTTDRANPVSRFQTGKVPVFLISLKAGGTGLNLTAADTVIHYDPWWNPAVEQQATDRAHRIGQTKNVFVYKLIAQGTIEQRMLELQERKQALASSILDETAGHSMSFSEQDLEYLLGPIDPV
jgi:SNF2 family DNA or RNA helicase